MASKFKIRAGLIGDCVKYSADENGFGINTHSNTKLNIIDAVALRNQLTDWVNAMRRLDDNWHGEQGKTGA